MCGQPRRGHKPQFERRYVTQFGLELRSQEKSLYVPQHYPVELEQGEWKGRERGR